MRNHVIINSQQDKYREIINKAKTFLSSKEGRKQIEEALRNAHKASEEMKKASTIDPSILHIPMSI